LSVPDKVRFGQAVESAPSLDLSPEVVRVMKERVHEIAERTVDAIIVEVPSYSQALSGPMGDTIANAVRLAFSGLLNLLALPASADPGVVLRPVLDGAYALGRGEARSGRSMDALLAAYRVGTRVAWREFVKIPVSTGSNAATIAEFAQLVFAYIDELSAASVTGHSDELATTGRVRQRYLEQLCHHLLTGAPAQAVDAAAHRAEWEAPTTLTAVLLPQPRVGSALADLDPRTLEPDEEQTDLPDEMAVLLVPDAHGRARPGLLRTLSGSQAVVGPARPWREVATSFQRAVRVFDLVRRSRGPAIDTEGHLVDLVLTADPEALADLSREVLSPLDQVRDSTADKLRETLRAWVLHHGRRDDIAAALFVHPQTVRYRLNQLRDLYGDRLDDPQTVLALTLALGRPVTNGAS
jgi:hypothetical protein